MFRSIGGRVSLGVLCVICLSILIIPFSVIRSGAEGEGGESPTEEPAPDTVAPVMTDLTITNGSTVPAPRPTMAGEFFEQGSGVNVSSVQILLDGQDVTMQASITVSEFSVMSATDLTDGGHVFDIRVSDNAGNQAQLVVNFTVQLQPQPPVLDLIGDQMVDVGNTLQLTLTASDPNNDPLIFIVSPLPLPANASLGAQTGVFTFTPALQQVGDIVLTFSVSDGALTAQETVTVTVNGPPMGSVTELSGRLLDTNDFVNNITTPIQGATVSLLNTNCSGQVCSTTTDSDGRFTLTDPNGVPFGIQTFDIDPSTVINAPPGVTYSGFREEIKLIEGVNNMVNRPFFIPRIDPTGVATIMHATGGQVINPNLNAMADIPANSTMRNGQPFDGDISLSEVPEGLAPAALPDALDPGLLLTMQPVGVEYTIPVPLTVPNTENLPVGSKLDLWSLDPTEGIFKIVGEGEVMADGMIHTISGGITGNSWHAFLASVGELIDLINSFFQSQLKCTKMCLGSETAVTTGDLVEEHEVVSYRSLGEERNVNLVYHSLHANPRPILSVNTTIPARAALPDTVSSQLTVAGIMQPNEVFTDTTGLNENVDETIRQAVQFDASGFPTGRYPYQLTLSNNYPQSSISSGLGSNIIINNQQDSDFGAGWTLEELQRLHIQPDGAALIEEGDGTTVVFRLVNGWALEFDGNDDVAQVGQVAQVGNHTIEAWLKQSRGQFGIVAGHLNGPRLINGCGRGMALTAHNSGAVGYFVDPDTCGGGPSTLSPGTFVGQWVHVAGTWDGTISRLYVNGVLADSVAASFTAAGYMAMGANRVLSSFNTFFAGTMDELRIWDHPRTEQEISSSMNTVIPPTTPGLIGYWRFDEGQGQVVSDISVSGRNAALGVDLSVESRDPQWVRSDAPITGGNTGGQFFLPPEGEFSTLVLDPNGTGAFIRTLKDGTVVHFDASGFHTSTVDRNGNTTTYAYDAQNRLQTITDPIGLVTTFNYGGDGKLDTIVDPAGRTTTLVHDAAGDLRQITDPDNQSRQFVYSSDHRMTQKTSQRNEITTYNYNFAGRNTRANRPDGSRRRITPSDVIGLVNPNGSVGTQSNPAPFVRPAAAVATFTDGEDHVTTFTTDGFGATTVMVDPQNRTTTTVRDENGNPTEITFPKGNGIKFVYDIHNPDPRARGNVLENRRKADMSQPDGPNDLVTVFTYEPQFNQVKTITDPRGNVTTMTFDYELPPADPRFGTAGNIVQIDSPQVNAQTPTTLFRYNAEGQTTEVQDPNGNIAQFNYFPIAGPLGTQGNLMNIAQDPTGINAVTQFGYDMNGNPNSITDAENHTTSLIYDNMNRLTNETNPLNFLTRYFYDAEGNLERTERQSDPTQTVFQTTSFTYDPLNNLETITDPLSRVTTFTYDNNSNLETILDAENNLTTYTYDERNLLFEIRDANTPQGVTTYLYDDNSNLQQINDANTNPTTYLFDGYDRLERTTYADGVFTEFMYDPNSNLTRVTNGLPNNGRVIEYDYDALNRLDMKRFPATPALDVDYIYDIGSRLTDANTTASQINFTYDNLNRVRTTTQTLVPGSYTLTYQYDRVGNQTQILYPSGKVVDYMYDANDRLEDILVNSANVVAYMYDPLDRREQKDLLTATAVRTTYQYTIANELDDMFNEVVGAANPFSSFDYGYDNVSNRTSLQSTRTSGPEDFAYQYNDIYELTNVTGAQTHAYFYDNVGNRTTVDGTSYTPNALNQYTMVGAQTYQYDDNGNLVSDGTNTYTYDEENRLASATTPGTSTTYEYDGFNRRVSKTVNGTTTYFVYNGDEVIEEYDALGVLAADYVYGDGIDEVISMSRGGADYFYHYDGLGSVTELTDSAGNVIESYSYDVYGLPNSFSAVGNPYYFTGRRWDPESNIYYYRARMYDPVIGRFLQRDPLGYFDSMNLYAYLTNDPINLIDPEGKQDHSSRIRMQIKLQRQGKWNTAGIRDILTEDVLDNTAAASSIVAFGLLITPEPTSITKSGSVIFRFLAAGAVSLKISLYSETPIKDAVLESAKMSLPIDDQLSILSDPIVEGSMTLIEASVNSVCPIKPRKRIRARANLN